LRIYVHKNDLTSLTCLFLLFIEQQFYCIMFYMSVKSRDEEAF
jgi:hypothetical protein